MACNNNRTLCISSSLLLISNLFYSFNAIDTITRTQFISDSENGTGTSLVSSAGNFKLGFFSPGKSRARYVGIWVNKISEHTVVWVANRETPIKNSAAGIFKIGRDGNLAIFIGNKSSTPLWSTNVSAMTLTRTSSITAKLLDSGNLVLVADDDDLNETVIWQSFDHPTDTLLPGMKFGLNRKTGLNHVITCWKSIDDPTPGEFSIQIDPRGATQLFIYKKSVPHWRAGPWNGRNLIGLPDPDIATRLQDGRDKAAAADYDRIDLVNITLVDNDNEAYIIFQPKKGALFSIIRLEPTGTSKRLIWHESLKWVKFGSSPRVFCDEYARCGTNAICNEDTLERCGCLPGFEPMYPQDWYLKCLETRRRRKKQLDECGKGDREGFVRLEAVKLPDARNSTVYGNMNLKECERECLKSCDCTGYAILDVNEGGQGCIAWYGELTDMRQYRDGHHFYLRVDAVELGNFSSANKLGRGGFGPVFKGQFANGQEIAVKRLSNDSGQVGGEEIQENTKRVVGTFGYMSPEYALGGLFSVKSDVFSFGVILLEIVSGKKNWGFYHESSSSNLLKYIWEHWRDNNALEIVDSCISNSCPVHDEVLSRRNAPESSSKGTNCSANEVTITTLNAR
ncbi:hypothetical protein LWI28_005337 [Acer negundo]|uniref:Non-specific serine/threonine protein kinase n=1 Tax=Acer negundo TaxID=4023 RepID=A0AAD5P3W3_ACENE|nr:hypothetical protein LWI28_005337 [Acer negundo]